MKAARYPRKLGFDTASYVDEDTARLFVMSGYRFVIRPLRRDGKVNDRPDISGEYVSLSRFELDGLLQAGLGVGVFQAAKFRGRGLLSEQHGADLGGNMRRACERLELPRGVTVWYDSEWTDRPDPDNMYAELVGWQRELRTGNKLRAGEYIGAGSICPHGRYGLTPHQHAMLPGFRAYWRGNSGGEVVPSIPGRGYALWQGFQCGGGEERYGRAVHGLAIDQDLCHSDDKGDRPYLIAA